MVKWLSSRVASKFASLTIGIMEYWENGILGYGKMVKCYCGKIHLEIETKMLINFEYSFSKQHSIIPSFHYSMSGA